MIPTLGWIRGLRRCRSCARARRISQKPIYFLLFLHAFLEGLYQMKRMSPLIQIVNHKIDPHRLLAPCPRHGHSKLVLVPLLARKPDQWHRRIALRPPGRAVEEPVRNVVQARQLLDLGVDDVRLLCFWGEDGKDGACGGDFCDVNNLGWVLLFAF